MDRRSGSLFKKKREKEGVVPLDVLPKPKKRRVGLLLYDVCGWLNFAKVTVWMYAL